MGLKSKVKGIVKKAIGWQSGSNGHSSGTLANSPYSPSEETLLSTPLDRYRVAAMYLQGQGIEVGALHSPLQVPSGVQVKYVDRLSVSDLRKHYPELADLPLVEVDILDDGEKLTRIPDSSQDFVIANHFIEHCQNPILSLQMMLRVLKPNGILYLGIPDKRYTFDQKRPVTDIAHLLRDYEEGPEWSKEQHFFEYAKVVWFGYTKGMEEVEDAQVQEAAENLIKTDYSIHFHVWTQAEILELFVTLKKQLNFPFEIELALKRQEEFIVILRKV